MGYAGLMQAVPEIPGKTTESPASDAAKASIWKRFWPLALLAAGFAAFLLSGASKYLSFEFFLQSREQLANFTRGHLALSLLIYAAVYVAAVTLSIPGALLLTISGGFLFGGWLGGAVTVISATLGATCLFLIARSSLGETLAWRSGPWLERLRDGFREDAASYMLFLRLVPVFPFWLVNLAPALLGVPLATFLWTTFLGVIPGTFAYSLAGAGLDSVISAQKRAYESCMAAGGQTCKLAFSPGSLVTRELIIGFAAIGLAALIPVLLKKWRGGSGVRRRGAGKESGEE